MTTRRFNGIAFDIDTGDYALHCLKMSLAIKDGTTVAKRNGKPDGYLTGDVEADGNITVDRQGLSVLTEAARKDGSFQDLKPFDMLTYANVGDSSVKVRAYGCKLNIAQLLDIDKSSTDETTFEIGYIVTSPNFVEIDGVPYARKDNNTSN